MLEGEWLCLHPFSLRQVLHSRDDHIREQAELAERFFAPTGVVCAIPERPSLRHRVLIAGGRGRVRVSARSPCL